jgi:phenylpropionate dioxygenase-like ring-hydroxylating dioxygenase large terminal subunit
VRRRDPGSLDLSRPWLSRLPLAWPLLSAVELGREQAMALQAFGLPLLLLRSADGVASAHIDRCPHRLVSFFSGPRAPLVEGDTVRCPFHHQTFNQQGRCVRTLHGESGDAEALLTLPLLEQEGFLWLPMSRSLFDQRGHLAMTAQQVEAARAAIRLPQEFVQLNDPARFHCHPLFDYRYPCGPWGLTITSGIDHTHGFHVHGIAQMVHQLRRWFGAETLSGMHLVCSDEERSVLVTYEQFSHSLAAYWKVGGAPNLWLNKLDEGLYIAVLFVPEDSKATMTRGCIYIDKDKWGPLEFQPLLHRLRDLSIQNSIEDRPFIESQARYLDSGELPIGNASNNDAPVYRFFRYLEQMTGTPIDFGFAKASIQEVVARNFWSS